jgi:hypothetical protein
MLTLSLYARATKFLLRHEGALAPTKTHTHTQIENHEMKFGAKECHKDEREFKVSSLDEFPLPS